MSDKKSTNVSIDGVEYDIEKFTVQQKTLLEHVLDLERKVAAARFNVDQLQVGREAFFNMLKQSLTAEESKAE